MRIGKSRIDKMDYILKDGLPPMEYVESEKDIRVVIDNKLTFNQHLSEKSFVELWNTWIVQHLNYYIQL